MWLGFHAQLLRKRRNHVGTYVKCLAHSDTSSPDYAQKDVKSQTQ